MHDRKNPGAAVIVLLPLVVVGKQLHDVRVAGHGVGQAGADGGRDLARVDEIAERLAAGIGLDRDRPGEREPGRMAVRLGLVHGALEPSHLRQIDSAIVLQHAANEDRGRHRIKRHPDALAGEIRRRADHPAIDRDIAVAEHARREHRQRHERAVAGGEAGDVLGARHLRSIELQRARHPIENLARAVDGEEVEIDPLGLHLLGVERQHAVVEPAGESDRKLGHCVEVSLQPFRRAGFDTTCHACPGLDPGPFHTRSLERSRIKSGTRACRLGRIFAIYAQACNSRYKPPADRRTRR